MILLTDVANKLEEILNSEDCPCDFSFVVKSAGYHLDSVSNKKKGYNQIPVFISQIGGEYNPVPNLKQVDYSYEVNIYYPVRFKEDFYNINPFLQETFVGKKLLFGSNSALCNINVAEYGEIIDFEAIREFENWIQENFSESAMHLFKRDEQVNEFYMSMKFRLYATSLGEGFIFGNDVKYALKVAFPTQEITAIKIKIEQKPLFIRVFARSKINDRDGYCAWKLVDTIFYTQYDTLPEFKITDKLYVVDPQTDEMVETGDNVSITEIVSTEYSTTETTELTELLVWDSSGTGASISPISEQLIGIDKFVRNTANIINFNKSIVVYPKDNYFWQMFLKIYNEQDFSFLLSVELTKIYTFGENEITYTFNQLALSLNENVALGEALSFTIAFGDGE